MRTIHKIYLKVTDHQVIQLPKDSTILTAQFQREILNLWALVDTDKKLVKRDIVIIGTGNPIGKDWILKYIDTCQQYNGELVWHIFEAFK